MPIRWLHLLLTLPTDAYSGRRDAQVRFLKLQAELLRTAGRKGRADSHPPADQHWVNPAARYPGGLLNHYE